MLQWVDHLHLCIVHQEAGTGGHSLACRTDCKCARHLCDLESEVPREMFPSLLLPLLATHFPRLRKLSIGRGCGSAEICAFGNLCPQLSSLVVTDIFAVSVTSLRHIAANFPCLIHLTLCCERQACSEHSGTWYSEGKGVFFSQQCIEWMDAAMVHLQHCSQLNVLVLDFWPSNVPLQCSTSWSPTPNSLDQVSITIKHSWLFTPACIHSRLIEAPTVHLYDMDRGIIYRHDLQALLQVFSILEILRIAYFPQPFDMLPYIIDSRDEFFEDLLHLEQRLDGGFQLRCAI